MNRVYLDVAAERERAHIKHSAKGNSREDSTWDDNQWIGILMEELGEVAHELTYDTFGGSPDKLRAELVQVAAMACSWIAAIDRSSK